MEEKEKEAIRLIHSMFYSLENYLRDFGGAVLLMDFCEEPPPREPRQAIPEISSLAAPVPGVQLPFNIWKMMAARDASMTVYHFGRTIENIRESLNDCPIFSEFIDHKELRRGYKLFKSVFPSFVKARHAVAHSAELSKEIMTNKKERFTGTHSGEYLGIEHGKNIGIVQILEGRTFKNTIGGIITECVIDQHSYEILGSGLIA